MCKNKYSVVTNLIEERRKLYFKPLTEVGDIIRKSMFVTRHFNLSSDRERLEVEINNDIGNNLIELVKLKRLILDSNIYEDGFTELDIELCGMLIYWNETRDDGSISELIDSLREEDGINSWSLEYMGIPSPRAISIFIDDFSDEINDILFESYNMVMDSYDKKDILFRELNNKVLALTFAIYESVNKIEEFLGS